jgi:Uncharacterised ArCR, COG2043
MDAQFTLFFSERWNKYFPGVELPICFYYTDEVSEADVRESENVDRCLIGNLTRVREGLPYVYNAKTPGCLGGKRFTGFSPTLRPKFEYFLSCGIPGEMEGERYKKTPELAAAQLQKWPALQAPAKWLVFKRWDRLAADEQPLAVIFFATADVLAGLFTLANFDATDEQGVIVPMGSGCSSIIYQPYREGQSATPRAVVGMFDISARPAVPPDRLTFTVSLPRFEQMVRNMDESFLITKSWDLVRKRLP